MNHLKIIVLVISLTFSSHGVNAKNLIINSDIPPRPNHPVDVFIKKSFNDLNIEIKFFNTPTKRSYREADSGLVDGTFPHILGAQQRYHNLVRVPVSLGQLDLVAVSRIANLDLSQGIDALKGYTVGYMAGWRALEPLTRNLPRVYAVNTEASLFMMLQQKRFDVIIYGRGLSLEKIKTDNLGQLAILEPALNSQPLYLYLNKKHQALIPALTQVLKQNKPKTPVYF